MAYYIRGLVNVQNARETGGLFLPKMQFSDISKMQLRQGRTYQ